MADHASEPVMVEVVLTRDGIRATSSIEIPRDQFRPDHDEIGEQLAVMAVRALRQVETTRDCTDSQSMPF